MYQRNMRKKLMTLTLLLFASFQVAMADEAHFITDDGYRSKMENAFGKKMMLVGEKFFDMKDLKDEKVDEDEQEALRFLYAYMPVADVTDYPTTFFLQNVRTAFQAQREMAWGKEVPELLFRHFVLPIRVNNENLDDSRQVFYQALKDRVKGMSMKDAILEVNHWCHERVTYQPSDGRTSAPLATIRSAYGRCGEESTFTVAALRAIGIPARQVYTPRWAHTDDNHAWVEAWADGKWYFLGACEPEAVLNLAWFNAPASRAMLMHTKAFGDYNGPEEVMLRTSNYTEINLIDNYGSSARIDFSVVDGNGQSVDGARVDFKIYNYAEFCSVVTKYTASDGKTFLSAGKGDMMVWASKDGKYGFAKASFGKDKEIVVKLNHVVGDAVKDNSVSSAKNNVYFRDSFDIVPPPEKANIPEVSAEMRAKNLQRFAYEDSIRHAYLATFYTKETAMKALMDNGLVEEKFLTRNGVGIWVPKGEEVSVNTWDSLVGSSQLTPLGDGIHTASLRATDSVIRLIGFLQKSSGNHAVILDFLTRHKDELSRASKLLSTLSDKDLRDIPMEILEDHFNAKSNQLSPRVENEMIITPFKLFFEKTFESMKCSKAVCNQLGVNFYKKMKATSMADLFRENPHALVLWIQENIRLNPDKKALQIAQTPVGVWNSRLTDERSRKIFFVDVARSLGIEARVDAVTKKTQYKHGGSEWIDVDFDAHVSSASSSSSSLSLSSASSSSSSSSLSLSSASSSSSSSLSSSSKFSGKVSPKGLLKLDYQANKAVDDPKYYSHFTLTRINADGSTSLLEYPEEGITWSNTFKEGVELDEGDYALVSGTRLANGGVLSEMQLFHVKHSKTTEVQLHLRTSETEVTVIGNFDSESKFELLEAKELMALGEKNVAEKNVAEKNAGKKNAGEKNAAEKNAENRNMAGNGTANVSLLSQTGRGYFIMGLIGVGQEPTNHALKDIAKVAKIFEEWNRPIVLLFEDETAAQKFRISEFPGLPKNIIFGIDKDGTIRKQVVENMKLTNANLLPIFTISDTFNRVVWLSQGYTIGLGEQLEAVIKKL